MGKLLSRSAVYSAPPLERDLVIGKERASNRNFGKVLPYDVCFCTLLEVSGKKGSSLND